MSNGESQSKGRGRACQFPICPNFAEDREARPRPYESESDFNMRNVAHGKPRAYLPAVSQALSCSGLPAAPKSWPESIELLRTRKCIRGDMSMTNFCVALYEEVLLGVQGDSVAVIPYQGEQL